MVARHAHRSWQSSHSWSRVTRLWAVVAVLLGPTAPTACGEWVIDTVAGTGEPGAGPSQGSALETPIGDPFGVEFGPDGRLYITEVRHHRVWALDLKTTHMRTVAGNGTKGYSGDGGPAVEAQLNEPYEVRFDEQGDLYFVEMQNHVVRKVDRKSGRIDTVAGTGQRGFSGDGGPARQARFSQPHSIALDGNGGLYVADIGNHRIRRVDLVAGTIETVAGNGDKVLPSAGTAPRGGPVWGPRALWIGDRRLWVALREGHSVWRFTLPGGTWEHVAGTGKAGFAGDGHSAANAAFNGPKGIALDKEGNIYIADTENHALRRIDARTGTIETIAGDGTGSGGFAGDGGPGRQARLNRPHGICVGPDGAVYTGDTLNHRVRRVRWQ